VALANVQGKFDWLIVDDYALAALHETPWRAVAKKILALDDLADRPHDCDLLVDSTPSRASGDYLGLVPAQARLLLGSSYAPLRAEFSLNRHIALERRKQTSKLQRLLVSFGLVDPGGPISRCILIRHPCLP
jgi:UDP-2,4-diacetamido-2,4,6-trideoxy-beta-L-altropyranose hydrolase